MSDPLAELNILQDRDLELDVIRAEQDQTPGELLEFRASYSKLEGQLLGLREQLRDVRMSYDKIDLEQRDLTAKRDRAKHSSDHASSPKEITQFGEIHRQLSERVDELDTDLVPLLERIEDLEGKVAGVQAEVDEAKPILEEMEAANAARVEKLQEDFLEKRFARDTLAENIPHTIMREYDAVRRAKKGTGLALIAKAGVSFKCTSCNVQLPMNVAQQVYGTPNPNKVNRCPSCGRILWKGE